MNKDKCRCERKELIDKGVSDKVYAWNPCNCKCECDKACDFVEYLDYKNCKCRKKLVAPLIEKCAETIEEVKIAKINLAENENSHKFSSYRVYFVLLLIFFIFNVGAIGAYYVYSQWYLEENNTHVNLNTCRETTIY